MNRILGSIKLSYVLLSLIAIPVSHMGWACEEGTGQPCSESACQLRAGNLEAAGAKNVAPKVETSTTVETSTIETKVNAIPRPPYEVVETLGKGTYGHVYSALLKDGSMVAIKETNKEYAEVTEKEFKLLREINHPNILKPIMKLPYGNGFTFAMEYLPGGSLFDLMTKKLKQPLRESVIKTYMWQVLKALEFLHRNWIAHFDIKPENIFLDPVSGIVKIGDFGSARLLEADNWPEPKGYSPRYVAPEAFGPKYSATVDIWSLGVTIVSLSTNKDPWVRKFATRDEFLVYLKDPKHMPRLPTTFSDAGLSFLKRCLTRDWKARPSAGMLLEDPWFKDIRSGKSSPWNDVIESPVAAPSGWDRLLPAAEAN